MFSSTPLLVELHGVMSRDKFANALSERGLSIQTMFQGYAALVHLVKPAQISAVVLGDPADDAVLACALAAEAVRSIGG